MSLPPPALPALLACAAAACAEQAPDDPTWAEVSPILAAHCIRCHGDPAIGGAPPTFRLDRYDDVVLPAAAPGASAVGVRRILGAAAMAEWIAERAGDGSMPPRIPLAQRDRDVLANWFANRRPVDPARDDGPRLPLRGDGEPGNAAPVLTAQSARRDDAVIISYQLRDPERDLVTGELFATAPDGARLALGQLHGGRGEVPLDAAALPPGTYRLEALLDDGHRRVTVAAGQAEVPALSPSPPRVALEAPEQGGYVSTDELPLSFAFTVADRDSPRFSALAMFVDDRIGPVPLQTLAINGAANTRTSLSFAPDLVSPGRTYRVVVEVNDGSTTTRAQSGRFRYEPASTSDTFQTISDDILGPYCLRCHAAFPRVPGLGIDLSAYRGTAERPGVYELRRRIYQRAVLAQDMPPGSARARGGALTAEERERLARWLLAGAPQ